MKNFDFAVIGAGLIGCAAAKYLSETEGTTCLIGPTEPKDWANHSGIFSSHYDESRIVSISAPSKELEVLDQESIEAYDRIHAESGITFFSKTGRLTAMPSNTPEQYPFLTETDDFEPLSPEMAQQRFGLTFPETYKIRFEGPPSGAINPRNLLNAQRQIAINRSVEYIPAIVKQVKSTQDGLPIHLHLSHGNRSEIITANKVLVSAGIYSNFLDIESIELPELPLTVESILSILFRCTPEMAEAYASMPPINYKTETDPIFDLSILTPFRYADGETYLKCVVFSEENVILNEFGKINQWFQSTPKLNALDALLSKIEGILPGLTNAEYWMKPCALCNTPSGIPIIDILQDGRIYTATGGSGGVAHTSDAIGKYAAEMMVHNRWTAPVDHRPFQIRASVPS